MKKIFIIVAFFLSFSSFVIIPEIQTEKQANQGWSPWQKVSCFKGLQYRTKRGNREADGTYWWSVQFRNLYNITTGFNYNITEPGRESEVRKNNEILDYWKLSANSDPERDGNDSPHAGNYVNAADKIFLFITNVKQPVNDNWDVPFKKCDY